MEAKFRKRGRRHSLVDDQPDPLRRDCGEAAQLLVADEPAGRDGVPFPAVENLDVLGLHTFAQGDILLDTRDIEGPGLAKVELDLAGGLARGRHPV